MRFKVPAILTDTVSVIIESWTMKPGYFEILQDITGNYDAHESISIRDDDVSWAKNCDPSREPDSGYYSVTVLLNQIGDRMTKFPINEVILYKGDDFQEGDQVASVPDEVVPNKDGYPDLDHPSVQFGFVTGVCGDGNYYVRYWKERGVPDLRTKANSEKTPGHYLIPYRSILPQYIDEFFNEQRRNT